MPVDASKPEQGFCERYFSGKELYGDDFDEAQILDWYREEERGYFDLVGAPVQGYAYEYRALNDIHGFSGLSRKFYRRCLAFGCATGDDVAQIAAAVDEFIAIEPAQAWWRDTIGGRPSNFLAPLANGEIPIPANSVDLVVCLGVLHHIPNVSKVIAEFGRVLKPEGILILREPISSMGDWRIPRKGLTKNERGLPPAWLQERLHGSGFTLRRRRHCMFSALSIVAAKMGIDRPYNHRWFVWVDWALSSLFRFNAKYRRSTFLEKLAPGSVFIVAARR